MPKLIYLYKDTSFIIGHAGILQVNEVIEKLTKYDNAFVDASFQSPTSIKNLFNE